jgi:opacity protein-like surface antigen
LPGAILSSALLAAGATPESALSQTAVSAGTPPSGPAISWTGAFVGGQVLGSLSTVSTTETTAATGALFHHFDTFTSGGGGGFDFGYNWLPWGNAWLAGVVADINFLSDSGGHVSSTMDNLMASGQMRVGLLATPALLCYGQTGVALARERLNVDFGGPITEQSRIAPGYAIGAGAEWVLPVAVPASLGAAPSLFADYQHI